MPSVLRPWLKIWDAEGGNLKMDDSQITESYFELVICHDCSRLLYELRGGPISGLGGMETCEQCERVYRSSANSTSSGCMR